MKKQFLLGLMAMTLPLATWAQTATVTENAKFTYDGGKKQPVFEVTLKNGVKLTTDDYSVSYTFTPVGSSVAQETSVETVKGAGTYNAKVVGAGNYDGFFEVEVETPIVVERVNLTGISLKSGVNSISKPYGTKDGEVNLDNYINITGELSGEGEHADALRCLTLVRVNKGNDDDYNSEDVRDEKYRASVEGQEVEGCNYYYNSEGTVGQTFDLIIEKRQLVVTVDNETYTGNTLTPSAKTNNILTTDADDVTIEFTLAESNTEKTIRNATTYSLTATVKDKEGAENKDRAKNYSAGTVNFTVTPATLTITAQENQTWSNTYGSVTAGADLTNQFDIKTWLGEDEENVSSLLKMKWYGGETVPTAAGSYEVKAYYDGKEVTDNSIPNYTLNIQYNGEDKEGQYFVINGKAIDSEGITLDIDKDDLAYNASDFTKESLENKLNVKDGETPLTVGTDYEITAVTKVNATAEEAAKNAGEQFNVIITGKGNYAGTETLSSTTPFTIGRATLTFTLKDEDTTFGKVYGDEEPENLIAEYSIAGWQGNEKSTLESKLILMRDGAGSDDLEKQNVGSYSVFLYYGTVDQAGYIQNVETPTGLPNYRINYDLTNTKFVITKKAVTYHIAATTAEYGKYDPSKSLPEFTVEVDGLVEADKEKDIFVSGKAPIVALAKDSEGKDVTAKNVGEYSLTITNEDEVEATNYDLTYDGTQEGHKDGKYTITAAPLTITVADQTITFADKENLDELLVEWAKWQSSGKQIVSFTGNKYSDGSSLRQFFTLGKSEALEKGEGEINEEGDDVYVDGIVVNVKDENDLATEALKTIYKNYEITGVPGTLTIEGENTPLVLDGSIEDEELVEKLKAMNGAVVKTVKIKNLQNVRSPRVLTAKQWYTLVLPFDVKVRDLSKAFGYAIVNVPNTANTNEDVISFQLTMDEIPANTLMTFKVDEDMPWAEDDEVEFTNKKIVYDPEAEPISDLAGNVFCGVYEKTAINDTNDWYIWTDGKVYSAGAAARTIYPLNGYVHFKEATANARIILEEADGSTTAINTVSADKSSAAEGWYSVDGVKLNDQPTQKGVYINNGKKVVIK